MQIRQGDLLFVQINKLPDGAVEDKTGVIARGEATGHTHRLRAGRGRQLLWAAGVAYIRALHKAYVDHEEHGTDVLPPATWQVIRQREYEPEGWRQVND